MYTTTQEVGSGKKTALERGGSGLAAETVQSHARLRLWLTTVSPSSEAGNKKGWICPGIGINTPIR